MDSANFMVLSNGIFVVGCDQSFLIQRQVSQVGYISIFTIYGCSDVLVIIIQMVLFISLRLISCGTMMAR